MIDATHELPLGRQAELLAISRSNLYYPFAGSRMLRDMLRLEGVQVGRQHVATLMAKMAITAISRQRNTSAPHPAHPIYPYLLKGLPPRPAQPFPLESA